MSSFYMGVVVRVSCSFDQSYKSKCGKYFRSSLISLQHLKVLEVIKNNYLVFRKICNEYFTILRNIKTKIIALNINLLYHFEMSIFPSGVYEFIHS